MKIISSHGHRVADPPALFVNRVDMYVRRDFLGRRVNYIPQQKSWRICAESNPRISAVRRLV
jgi:hypothetical protein